MRVKIGVKRRAKRRARRVKRAGKRVSTLKKRLTKLHVLFYYRIDLACWEAVKAVRERNYEAFKKALEELKGDLKEAEELGEALKEAARLEVGRRGGVKA
ncbi:MAG: hypothetical protein QXG68_07870 [Candidatus Bathyarchaeia archaeon]